MSCEQHKCPFHQLHQLTKLCRAGNDYPKLDGTDANPGFCYDIGMLLPQYNPLAVLLPTSPSATTLAASPLSTVLVFGLPLGARSSIAI